MNCRAGKKGITAKTEGAREKEGGMKEIQTNIETEGRIQGATNLHGNTAITTSSREGCVCVCPPTHKFQYNAAAFVCGCHVSDKVPVCPEFVCLFHI